MAAGMRQKALASALNRPLSWVRSRLALAALPEPVQQAVDAGTYEPSDALTFAKYADRPDVIDIVLSDNYRSGSDLDWRLERAARRVVADREHAELIAECQQAGWATYDGHSPTDTHRGAKRLSEVGVDDPDTHRGEPCHLVVISRSYNGEPTVDLWCSDPRRHGVKGASEIKATRSPQAVSGPEQTRRDQAQATRAANAHRAAFAREAVAAKLRSRDLLEFVLPVLFDCSGQTEKKDAARLLGIEPVRDERSTYPDYTTPLTEWAAQSSAHLTRAMLAVAYSLAATRGPWNQMATEALAGLAHRASGTNRRRDHGVGSAGPPGRPAPATAHLSTTAVPHRPHRPHRRYGPHGRAVWLVADAQRPSIEELGAPRAGRCQGPAEQSRLLAVAAALTAGILRLFVP